MAIIRKGVFIASRFDEFDELRKLVGERLRSFEYAQLEVVDMNDGRVGPNPPLKDCLASVRASDFMILLVGDSYGGHAPGHSKSFTHLEYEEALRTPDLRILPFFRGESYRGRKVAVASDPGFAAWQKQLQDHHTVGFIEPDLPLQEAADYIADGLLAALWNTLQLEGGRVGAEDDEGEEALLEDDQPLADVSLSESEVEKLERSAMNGGDSALEGEELLDSDGAVLRNPNRVAALEHRDEAMRALKLGLYGAAISHLRRCVRLRPLDLMGHYWLARAYLIRDEKPRFEDAERHALQAARLAGAGGQNYRAAAALMLAAEAAARLDRGDEALKHAERAREIAPRFSRTYVAVAREHARAGQAVAAIRNLRRAFDIHPPSLREAQRDPVFRVMQAEMDAFIRQRKRQLLDWMAKIADTENRIAGLGPDAPEGHVTPLATDTDLSLYVLVNRCRKQVLRAYNVVNARWRDCAEAARTLPAGGRRLSDQLAELQDEQARLQAEVSEQTGVAASASTGLAIGGAVAAAALLVLALPVSSAAVNNVAGLAMFGSVLVLYFSWSAHSSVRDSLAKNQRELAEISAFLARSEGHYGAFLRARALFESEIARPIHGAVWPFPSPHRARSGKVIRLATNRSMEEHGRQYGLRLQLRPGEATDPPPLPDEGAPLYRVVARNGDEVILSRQRAYASS